MNLQQLQYFCAVARLEHYTLAASRLMVSPSSLSHAISDLEKELGIPLFEPSGRNIRLTKYGRLFLTYAESALDTLEEGKKRLHDFIDPETGTVVLAHMSSLNEFIPYLISRYLSETGHTGTMFHIFPAPTGSMREGLLNGSIDLALTTRLPDSCFESFPLGEHRLVVLVSKNHPLAAENEIYLRNLKNEKIVGYSDNCQISGYIGNLFANAGLRPEFISRTDNDSIIVSSVAANIGISLIPTPLAPLPYNTKALRILDDVPPREVCLVYKKMRYEPPVLRNFLSFVSGCASLWSDFSAAIAGR